MKQTRIFAEWRQGSSASGDPDKTEYNAVNSQVYENGTLGPRPGWKSYTPNTASARHSYTSGLLRGLTWHRETTDDEHVVMMFDDGGGGTEYDRYDVDGNAWVGGGDLPEVTNSSSDLQPPEYDDTPKQPSWSDGFLITTLGPYYAVATSTTLGSPTAPTFASGDFLGMTIYRDRAYYWGNATQGLGRVFYSEPADFANVPTANSFDVNIDSSSSGGAVIGMWSIKNALLIATLGDTWHTLTGTSPESGTFKTLGQDLVPDFLASTVVDNQLWYLHRSGLGVVVATPAYVDAQSLRYLSPLSFPGSTEQRPENSLLPIPPVGDEVTQDLFLPGRKTGNSREILAVERANGIFNLSRWNYTDGTTLEDILFTGGRPGQMWATIDDTDSAVKMFSRDTTLNRPANSGDTRSVSLANEAGTTGGTDVVVDLAEITAGPGKIVRPAKVILDIDYWKGGNYSAPELAVDATIEGCIDAGSSSNDVLTQQVVTTTGWGDTSGDLPSKRRVAVTLPQGQYGTRFRIRLTYDNLAIDTVQVYYEENEDQR